MPALVAAVPALGDRTADAVTAVTAVVLVGLLALIVLVGRRLSLGSMRGTFECYIREVNSPGAAAPGAARTTPWRAGLARYDGSRIAFFATLAFRWWPSRVFDRNRLEIVDRLHGAEASHAPPVATGSAAILRCRHDGNVVELAMDEMAASGFAVWVESGPPGRGINVA